MTAQLIAAPVALVDLAPGAEAPERSRVAVADWARLIVATLARVVLLTILGALFWAAIPAVIGWMPTTVMSNSMAPRFFAGDVVVSMPATASNLQLGRTLLVDDPDQAGRLRLHRWVARDSHGDFITKGDANPARDSSHVTRAHVRGVAILRVPLVGLPFVWMSEHRWALVLASGIGLAGLAALSGIDSHLRRERDAGDPDVIRPRVRRAPTLRLALGSGALIGVAALVISTGAHAAFAASTLRPVSGFSTQATSGDWCSGVGSVLDSPSFLYRYSESAGTVANDSSAAANTGTLTATGVSRTGGSCSTTPSPYATFTGTGSVSTTTQLTTAPYVYSVEAWFKAPTTGFGGRIIGFGNQQTGTSGQYDRQLYMNTSGKLVFGTYNLGYNYVTSPASYTDNAWHHVVVTMDGSAMGLSGTGEKMYVDGAVVASNAFLLTSENHSGYWRVGNDNLSGWTGAPTTTGSMGFVGALDSTAAYSTALSAAQVAAHYAAGH